MMFFVRVGPLTQFIKNKSEYSCNKINTTQIQIPCQNFFSNDSQQMIIWLTPIVIRAKSKWYKPKNVKILALNSHLLSVHMLTNDIQVLILFLSYFITAVSKSEEVTGLWLLSFPLFDRWFQSLAYGRADQVEIAYVQRTYPQDSQYW